MKVAKKNMPVQVIKAKEQNGKYEKAAGLLCLALLFACGSMFSLQRTLGSLKTGNAWILITVAIGVGSGAYAYYRKKNTGISIVVRVLPWVFVLAVTGFHGYWSGARAWFNQMISMWNEIHKGGVALFAGQATTHDIWAFSLVASLLIGQISWEIAAGGHTVFGEGWCIVWGILMLLTGTFTSVACSFLLAGIMGLGISGRNVQITRTGIIWTLGLTVSLGICAGMVGNVKMISIEEARKDVVEKIHEIRYGKTWFPEGNLYQADELKDAGGKELLSVISEQEKTLYLKAFVGGIYQNGKWEQLSDSEYGGENAGMLEWLKKKHFSPLTQSAAYYKVGKEKDIKENQVKIEVKNGSRDYFYAPASLEKVTSGKIKEKQDQGLETTGLTGESNYTFKEISGVRPSELTVAADWVENPQNKKQKQYSAAEAVYRQFVYDHYTVVDKKMYALIDEIFWENYSSDSDGIYSALTQIRKVLKEQYQYTERTDMKKSGSDPLRYFLKDSCEGNEMLYASAAVEAFRVHGIPARYVEGYYIPSEDIGSSKDGKTSVTGKNAHAWAEVYFDGAGWLPVDVTPGYYYDVATLQKMVNTPQDVQKNAALKNNSFGGKHSTDLSGVKNKVKEKVKQAAKQTLLIWLGMLALLLILLVAGFSVVEIVGIYIQWRDEKRYEKASVRKKTVMIEKELFCIFKCMGIQACLGWNMEETGKRLTERVPAIEAEEYERVCELLEKMIYGDIELENFEIRTLENFLKKLLKESKTCSFKIRMKIRYRYLPLQ